MSFVRRIVLDFLRRRRFLLGLLCCFYFFCCFTLAIDSGSFGWKLACFLSYAIAPSLGAVPFLNDAARGWHRTVHLLSRGSESAARISWFICVGIPTLVLLLLYLPAALFTFSDLNLFYMSIILPIASASFASASVFYFSFMLMPANLSPNSRKRSLPRATLMVISLVLWLFGMFLVLRWSDSGRQVPDVLFFYFVLVGFILSVAGFRQVKTASSGVAPAESVSDLRGSRPVKSRRKESKPGLTGWGILSAQCIVRQAGLAFAAVLIYLLYTAARVYFFGEVAEFKYETEQRSLLPSILLAGLVTVSYAAMFDGFSSTRLLRTLPLSTFRCGLRLIGSVYGAFVLLIVLVGGAFFLFWDDIRSVGWFLCLLGAAGPASLSIPCAVYLRGKGHDTIISGLLVLAATAVWTHSSPLIAPSSLVIVAPIASIGGNLLSLLLVIQIFSRSSRAYRQLAPQEV